MFSIRRSVFETNSSSTHSITISGNNLSKSKFEVLEDWEFCNGEPTIFIDLQEFCGYCDHDTQEEKLAYLVQQIAYITDNEYALRWYGTTEQQEEAINKLYESEEFKSLEDEICDYVGCKHIRINLTTSGYIDHDSVCYNMEELRSECFNYIDFVFGNDSYVHFEFNG